MQTGRTLVVVTGIRVLVVALGIALIGLFAYCLGQKLLRLTPMQTAEATVVALKPMGNSTDHYPRKPPLFPVVRFRTAQGQSVTVTGPTGSRPAAYQIGQQVQLSYNPADPQQVELPDFFSQWGAILITSLFALLGWRLVRAGWK